MTYPKLCKNRLFAAWAAACLMMAIWLVPSRVWAGSISGHVTRADGTPLAGVMITISDNDENRRRTVYSSHNGSFSLASPLSGNLKLRARLADYRDFNRNIKLGANEHRAILIALRPLRSPEMISDQLTASAHATRLKWKHKYRKATFISQCHYCHQIGNELTRQPRSIEEWREVINRMEGYFAVITPWDKWEFERTLAKGFDGKPFVRHRSSSYGPHLDKAVFDEWKVGDGMSFIHDMTIGSDGHFYGVDQGHDILWEVDPKSGRTTPHHLPDSDLPEGGLYSGAQLPIGIFTGKHGPHSLAESRDGRFWITGSLSSTLISFDIKSKKFKVYEIGHDALYPHTIRIDKKGIVWFTLPASNQVGRFDPKTGKFRLVDLPSNGFARWLTDAFFPYILKIASYFPKKNTHILMSHHWWTGLGRKVLNFPYGIDIEPGTGRVWYSKLYANKIGYVDPKTFKVVEFDTPLTGPRRLRFDKKGILWIPSFNQGGLMRFDPQTRKFKTYRLPQLGPGEYEVPYALNIHPRTQQIWITTNQSDRILRFDPKTEKFAAYPSPTRVTYLRDIVFDKKGRVCASNSNLPAYAIEGGRPVMLCLDPGGGN